MKRYKDATPAEKAHYRAMAKAAGKGKAKKSTANYGTKKHTGSYIAKHKRKKR